MLNARSVYRRVAILHSLQSERPITIKIHVRNSSSSQCKILPRVPHAESSFPGLTLDIRVIPPSGQRIVLELELVLGALSQTASAVTPVHQRQIVSRAN